MAKRDGLTRYERFKLSGSEELYSIWLRQKMDEWAASSRRGEEIAQERRDGWQFPILCSQQDHDEFDAWLDDNYLSEGES